MERQYQPSTDLEAPAPDLLIASLNMNNYGFQEPHFPPTWNQRCQTVGTSIMDSDSNRFHVIPGWKKIRRNTQETEAAIVEFFLVLIPLHLRLLLDDSEATLISVMQHAVCFQEVDGFSLPQTCRFESMAKQGLNQSHFAILIWRKYPLKLLKFCIILKHYS